MSLAFAMNPKNEACRALCVRDGYNQGKAYKLGCACIDLKENYEQYVTRSMSLGPRPDVAFNPDPKANGEIRVIFNKDKEEFEY